MANYTNFFFIRTNQLVGQNYEKSIYQNDALKVIKPF